VTERSIIALVSTPSGFAGRTDAIEDAHVDQDGRRHV